MLIDEKLLHKPNSTVSEKEEIRNKIFSLFDLKSLFGTVSDVTGYLTDKAVMDILITDRSNDASYRTSFVNLYEELHGEGAWEKVVEAAELWFEGRKSGTIKTTADVKGVDAIILDMAERSTSIAHVLEQTKR